MGFSLFFANSPQFWLNLQSHFDLEKATRSSFEKIKTSVKPLQAA
jgi:plasmid maintenance system antidote protein VapI